MKRKLLFHPLKLLRLAVLRGLCSVWREKRTIVRVRLKKKLCRNSVPSVGLVKLHALALVQHRNSASLCGTRGMSLDSRSTYLIFPVTYKHVELCRSTTLIRHSYTSTLLINVLPRSLIPLESFNFTLG
jgi:hypothetical protein